MPRADDGGTPVVLHDLRERLVYGAFQAGASPARPRTQQRHVRAREEDHEAGDSGQHERPVSPLPLHATPPPVAPPRPRAVQRTDATQLVAACCALLLLLLAACAAWPSNTSLAPPAPACAAPADLLALQRRVVTLEERMASLASTCEAPQACTTAAAADSPPAPAAPPPPFVVPREVLAAEVTSQLDLFWADRTGRADYALVTAGGAVVAHSPLHVSQALPSSARLAARMRGADADVHPRADEWLLTSVAESPGHCLALNGSSGAFVDVMLRERVNVAAISLEHVHRGIAFDSRSAVRAFTLLAVDEEMAAEGRVLAQGSYDGVSGAPVQTFGALAPPAARTPVRRVRFAVHSNHGADFTCLYRLRVHGAVPKG